MVDMEFEQRFEDALQAMEKVIHENPKRVHNFVWIAILASKDKVTAEDGNFILDVARQKIRNCGFCGREYLFD